MVRTISLFILCFLWLFPSGSFSEMNPALEPIEPAIYDPEEAIHVKFELGIMAVWFDDEATLPGIYGIPLDRLGNPLGEEFLIQPMPGSEPVTPAMVFDGAHFFVVWEDGVKGEQQNKIKGLLISPDGRKAGSEILINDAVSMKTEVSLAHDGKNFLVTWTDDRNSRFDMTQSQGISIYGHLVSLDGFRVEDEISIATGIFNQTAPSISYNGYAFLLVWQRTPVQGCGSSIMAKIVFRSGVIPSPGFPVSHTTSCNYVLDQPSVSADKDRFLVVWGKYKGKKDIRVFGQIVDTMGELVGETILMSKPSLHHLIVPSHGFEENTEREPDLHF